MKSQIKCSNLAILTEEQILEINGGGLLYDIYRIILEEKDDFVKGFLDGFNNGPF